MDGEERMSRADAVVRVVCAAFKTCCNPRDLTGPHAERGQGITKRGVGSRLVSHAFARGLPLTLSVATAAPTPPHQNAPQREALRRILPMGRAL